MHHKDAYRGINMIPTKQGGLKPLPGVWRELMNLLWGIQVFSLLGPAQVSFDLLFHKPNLN